MASYSAMIAGVLNSVVYLDLTREYSLPYYFTFCLEKWKEMDSCLSLGISAKWNAISLAKNLNKSVRHKKYLMIYIVFCVCEFFIRKIINFQLITKPACTNKMCIPSFPKYLVFLCLIFFPFLLHLFLCLMFPFSFIC